MTKVFTHDPMLHSVALSGGSNKVIYDKQGNPNWMVGIPAYQLDWIATDLGNGLHPAFRVDGADKKVIWIGQFTSSMANDVPVSCPDPGSLASLPFLEAREKCREKGPGWHMITNNEWAAIALWCLYSGFQPEGNTNHGRSFGGKGIGLKFFDSNSVITPGSGPITWRHNLSAFGIADLVGNINEWVDGIKLVDGVITLAMHWKQPENQWVSTGVFPADTNQLGTDGDSLGTIDKRFSQLTGTDRYNTNVPTGLRQKLRQALIDPGHELGGNAIGKLLLAGVENTTSYLVRGGDYQSQDDAGLASATAVQGTLQGVRVAYVP